MPHASGVAVARITIHHNGAYHIFKVRQISVDNIHVNAVFQGNIVFQFPEGISNFHIGAVFAQNISADNFFHRSGAVQIHVIIGSVIKVFTGPGTAQGNCFDLG